MSYKVNAGNFATDLDSRQHSDSLIYASTLMNDVIYNPYL
jgi:hypothetical protein